MASLCEHGNEHSGFIKCKEFLDQLKNWLFKKDCSVHLIGWLVSWLVWFGRSVCLLAWLVGWLVN